MICPHCNKLIEDRWIYPIGTRLFRRGLHNSFHNVTVIGHCLSVKGRPIYEVKHTYHLNYEDEPEPTTFLVPHCELEICEPTEEKMVVIPESLYEKLKQEN